MHIEHIAIAVEDLEKMRLFYEKYFDVTSSEKYRNKKTTFESYFLSFSSGSRIELTTKKHVPSFLGEQRGYSHLAIDVSSKEAVDEFAARMNRDGYPLLSGPRTTGDGYYEAVIQDPEGNLIELTTAKE